MPKIKDIPKIDRPRERFLKKGPDALSKSDLLAILLGSGIKGKNVQALSQQIIQKFGKNFLNITVENLKELSGIGEAKSLQIAAAISLVKRFFEEQETKDIIIKNTQDVIILTQEIKEKKKEHLVCIYLNAKNALLKKETVSIGLLDKTLLHPREIFQPATELNAASVILVHNHPTGDFLPSEKDIEIVEKITQAGKIMDIAVLDFIIISTKGHYSFAEKLSKSKKGFNYLASGEQLSLFELLEIEKPIYEIKAEKIQENYFYIPQIKYHQIQLHNRRYIGNKYKLIEWIFSIIQKECKGEIFADIFAGTGVISAVAIKHYKKIIINDFLYSNNVIYHAFFGDEKWNKEKIDSIIKDYNNIYSEDLEENYFSDNFGGKYFSRSSAKKIGFIRNNIEENKEKLTKREYCILLTSLI